MTDVNKKTIITKIKLLPVILQEILVLLEIDHLFVKYEDSYLYYRCPICNDIKRHRAHNISKLRTLVCKKCVAMYFRIKHDVNTYDTPPTDWLKNKNKAKKGNNLRLNAAVRRFERIHGIDYGKLKVSFQQTIHGTAVRCVHLICPTCNNEFPKKAFNMMPKINPARYYYCSVKCAGIAKSQNGGTMPLNGKPYFVFNS